MKKPRMLAQMKEANILSKMPLVELAGKCRVLIENHLGVLAYSPTEIQIKVSYGKLAVTGSCLKLMEMNKEQLVITGNILAVQLYGR